MKSRNFSRIGRHLGAGLVALTVTFMLSPGLALAQNDVQNADTGWAREIHENIGHYADMETHQQDQMRANLERCLQLGMNAEQVRTLFPDGDFADHHRAEDMLAHQHRILAVGEAGLPIGPMMEKVREGHMKHVRPGMMDRVLAQTDHNLRISDRVMRETLAGGVGMSGHHGEMSDAVVDLSNCLWDGLHEEDMEHLGQNARRSAQEGGCNLDEFVAANQAATRFTHSGMERQRAVALAGEAIHNGYSAQEMHTMGEMMMTSAHQDGDHHQMMDSMDGWIHDAMSLDEMTEHMMNGGWMGPADMMGPGGHHPMNDGGMGGAGHDGGMGDDGHGGGMGGGHGHN